jgi:hypothetical protein
VIPGTKSNQRILAPTRPSPYVPRSIHLLVCQRLATIEASAAVRSVALAGSVRSTGCSRREAQWPWFCMDRKRYNRIECFRIGDASARLAPAALALVRNSGPVMAKLQFLSLSVGRSNISRKHQNDTESRCQHYRDEIILAHRHSIWQRQPDVLISVKHAQLAHCL